jgi:hypothetical protein
MPVMGIYLLAVAGAGSAEGRRLEGVEPRVITDGRLRPGHFETIRIAGFPGKGVTQVSFLPTAICEDSCGGRSFQGGRTNARGGARFRVRVPGTFIDHRNRLAYFRDGERINVLMTWEGPDHSFASGSAEPEPIIVRTNGPRHG